MHLSKSLEPYHIKSEWKGKLWTLVNNSINTNSFTQIKGTTLKKDVNNTGT